MEYCIKLRIVIFVLLCVCVVVLFVCFFQAEDGIRDLVRSRGLGDVYKRQIPKSAGAVPLFFKVKETVDEEEPVHKVPLGVAGFIKVKSFGTCLLYTSDAADERSSVDLGGRRIITKNKKKKKKKKKHVIYKKTSTLIVV